MRFSRSALFVGVAWSALLTSPSSAQTTPGDLSGTSSSAGPGQSAATSTNAPAVSSARTGNASEAGGDIIVTARRVEERLQDVPISITVFNQQQISNRNIVTASDLASYTPSLATNTAFGANNSSFAIRGFTQETQTAPSVGVFFADVIAPRSQGNTTSGNGAGPGAFFDLQNVQVLKGPQGTLFGRNTTGGDVLLVPQKPTSDFGGYIEGSYGNYDMKRVQAVINAPLADWARLRLGIDYQDRDGYVNNKSGIGPKDFDDLNYYSLRASLVLDLSPDVENYTIGTFSRSNSHGNLDVLKFADPTFTQSLGAFLAPLAAQQLARGQARGDGYYDAENGNPFAKEIIQQFQAINTTTWRASDTLTIKNIASYAQVKQDQSTNLFGDNFFLPGGLPLSFVGYYQHPGYNNVKEYTFTEELQLQGRSADDRLTYQAGAYFEKSGPIGFQGTYANVAISCTNVQTLQCSDPLRTAIATGLAAQLGIPVAFILPSIPPIGSVTESFSKYNFRNLAAYAQATYKITNMLSITGGIRYTSDRVRSLGEVRKITFPSPNVPVYNCTIGGQPAPTPDVCDQRVSTKSSKPTWLIDVDYKPSDDVLVYGKYSRGYRAGGLNTSNPGFETWGPEKVDAFEIGAKTSFLGSLHGTFDIAGFYNNLINQQLQANAVATAAGTPIAPIVNAGKSRIYGVEVDTSITPFTGFTLGVGYTYLNTKLKSFIPPLFDHTLYSALLPTAVVGGPLTLSPKNRVTTTATYALPVGSNVGRVSIAATFTHTDKQVASAASILGVLPPTDLLNLNLNWSSIFQSKVDLSVFVTNLTADKYYSYVAGAYSAAGYESVVVGQPRMYGARLRYSF